MTLLSISTFFFSSMGSRSIAPESRCSARSGLCRAWFGLGIGLGLGFGLGLGLGSGLGLGLGLGFDPHHRGLAEGRGESGGEPLAAVNTP